MKKKVVLLLIISIAILCTGCGQEAKNSGDMKEQQRRWVIEHDEGVIDQVTLKKIEEELDRVDHLDSQYLVLMPLEKISNTNYIQVYNDASINHAKSEEEKFHVEVCFLDEDDFELRGKDNLKKEEVHDILKDYFISHKIPDTKDWYLVRESYER